MKDASPLDDSAVVVVQKIVLGDACLDHFCAIFVLLFILLRCKVLYFIIQNLDLLRQLGDLLTEILEQIHLSVRSVVEDKVVKDISGQRLLQRLPLHFKELLEGAHEYLKRLGRAIWMSQYALGMEVLSLANKIREESLCLLDL